MRVGTVQAIHHARHRSAFGNTLVDQPAMQNVLADLAVESEAATATAMRIARGYDEDDAAFRRVATAVSKYWVCKRAPLHAVEALECLGGNGYVEESGMPRLLRDSPLNSIWEGSGNVAALDVLRALAREQDGLPAFLAEVEQAAGADARLDAHVDGAQAAPGRPGRRRTPSSPPAGWSRTWAWRCRARCWCATRRRRWPTRSAPRAWRARAATPGARCPRAPTPGRSWTARWPA